MCIRDRACNKLVWENVTNWQVGLQSVNMLCMCVTASGGDLSNEHWWLLCGAVRRQLLLSSKNWQTAAEQYSGGWSEWLSVCTRSLFVMFFIFSMKYALQQICLRRPLLCFVPHVISLLLCLLDIYSKALANRRLRGNIIGTALCWIVWHNVHSQQHTYMSSSYRSKRLGLSHWNPYAVRRGCCLELYYCNIAEWFWWDSNPVSYTHLTLPTILRV